MSTNTVSVPVPFNRVPQQAAILAHLHTYDSHGERRGLSHDEARGLYRCRRLSARIYELRKMGYRIISKERKDATGVKYVRYFLA